MKRRTARIHNKKPSTDLGGKGNRYEKTRNSARASTYWENSPRKMADEKYERVVTWKKKKGKRKHTQIYMGTEETRRKIKQR